MGTTVVRYKVGQGKGDENQELVEAVFAELATTQPDDLRYATIRLEDGVSFIHIARTEGADSPLVGTKAFEAFREGLQERCVEPPAPAAGTIIGNHGLFA